MAGIDTAAISEIEIFMDSDKRVDAGLEMVYKNLINMLASGKYQTTKAPKAFIANIIRAEGLYQKEYGNKAKTLLSGKERLIIAQRLTEYFEKEAALGNFKHLLNKKNSK